MALTDDQKQKMMNLAMQGFAPNSLNFPDQRVNSLNVNGYGACDATANNYKQALENWRYSTAYFKWVRDGATGDLSIAAETTITLLNGGSGEKSGDSVTTAGLPGTVTLSNVETDLFKTGAPTKQNAMFRMQAFGGAALKPFTLPDPFETKRYDRWLENYEQPMIDAIHNNVAFALSFDAEECNWLMGLLSFYPQHANSTGAGSIVRNGAGIGIAQIMPLRVPADLGSQDRANQAIVTGTTSKFAMVLGNDAVIPTEDDAYMGIQGIFYGGQLCEPCAASSCFPQLSALIAAQPENVKQAMLAQFSK